MLTRCLQHLKEMSKTKNASMLQTYFLNVINQLKNFLTYIALTHCNPMFSFHSTIETEIKSGSEDLEIFYWNEFQD